jgi:hypothetical protein
MYIVPMKMPKTCYDCNFEYSDYGCNKCKLTKEYTEDGKRLKSCPLIELPNGIDYKDIEDDED